MNDELSADLTSPGFVSGNHYDKYRTSNRLHRWLMERFLADATELVAATDAVTVLEVGCGPGDLADRMLRHFADCRQFEYLGTDVSADEVCKAQRQHPDLQFSVASLSDLPFADRSFDLVIGCEVLEHVDNPVRAMSEISRVARHHALISVPWEPYWRALNCLRGAYLTSLGNTPGHVNHFSRSGIRELATATMEICAERNPFPWTMLLLSAKQR